MLGLVVRVPLSGRSRGQLQGSSIDYWRAHVRPLTKAHTVTARVHAGRSPVARPRHPANTPQHLHPAGSGLYTIYASWAGKALTELT